MGCDSAVSRHSYASNPGLGWGTASCSPQAPRPMGANPGHRALPALLSHQILCGLSCGGTVLCSPGWSKGWEFLGNLCGKSFLEAE